MTEITDIIKAYRAGDLNLDQLVVLLGHRSYPLQDRYRKDLVPPDLATHEDWPDGTWSQDGTWDEVTKARNTGLLTAADYAAISAAQLGRSR